MTDMDKFAAAIQSLTQRVADLEEALADKRRLTRELDIEMHGDGAAAQASLCDLIGSGKKLRERAESAEQRLAVVEGELADQDELVENTVTECLVILDQCEELSIGEMMDKMRDIYRARHAARTSPGTTNDR